MDPQSFGISCIGNDGIEKWSFIDVISTRTYRSEIIESSGGSKAGRPGRARARLADDDRPSQWKLDPAARAPDVANAYAKEIGISFIDGERLVKSCITDGYVSERLDGDGSFIWVSPGPGQRFLALPSGLLLVALKELGPLWTFLVSRQLVLDCVDLAALLPNAPGEVAYLYREVEFAPRSWWKPVEWRDIVEAWLTLAQGSPTCVDRMVGFLEVLSLEDQARLGVPWITTLILSDPARIGNRSFLISSWLINVRSASQSAGTIAQWQQIVDALVVAGVAKLAPYSE